MMRPRLDPALAGLIRALKADGRGGRALVILDQDSVPWASLTFNGARHRLTLRCGGAAGAAALAAALPEMDLPIPGHLVAEVAAIVLVDDALTFEALTVELD